MSTTDIRGRAAPIVVYQTDSDGAYVGEVPDAALASALEVHVRRVAREGGAADVALTLEDTLTPRTLHAALRALAVGRGVVVAVTERPSADASRLKRFDLALEATADGIWEWVVADGAVWWSERTNELFGYPPGTAPDYAGWTERIHPDDRERVLSDYETAVEQGAVRWQDDYRMVRVDGSVRHVTDRGLVERDASGRAIRLVGVMTDVTEMRTAERARDQANRLFSEVADTIEDIIWLSDTRTKAMLYLSPAFERVVGIPNSVIMANREAFFALFHPDDRERMLASLPAQTSGRYDETYRIVRPDGNVRWLRTRVIPVHDEAGNVVRITGQTTDVTAQRKLEEQLLQSRKMESVGRLAGGVAHDFNNLLTVVLSGCDFALRQLPESVPARSDIQTVRAAAERAATLTSQLLSFARRQVIAPVRIDLNELARQMDGMLQRLIGEHIQLVTTLGAELHMVLADRGQLEQVLVNLAVNARDAMPSGGRLTIETANVRVDRVYADAHAHLSPGEYVMIAVSDTGVGISREVQEHLFEPFFTTKPAGHGTGLGLATCYGIVRQAGGQILLYSELGRGSTFKILLPRSKGDAERHAETHVPPSAGGHETVLFVEDDALVRQVGVRILSEHGYRVLEAEGGAEALRIAGEHAGPIHLLVTDVVMPHMNGTELAKRLRQARPETLVLYASGYTENAIVHHGVLEPAVSFLQKPYVVESLLAKVRALLDHVG